MCIITFLSLVMISNGIMLLNCNYFLFYFLSLFFFINSLIQNRAQKTKPGKVVHLSDSPLDSSKILIGYDSGLIVLWNIKVKRAEHRFNGTAEVNLNNEKAFKI